MNDGAEAVFCGALDPGAGVDAFERCVQRVRHVQVGGGQVRDGAGRLLVAAAAVIWLRYQRASLSPVR